MLLNACLSVVLYVLLLRVVPDLHTAEPSFAGEVFPWVPLLTLESLAAARSIEIGRDSLGPVEVLTRFVGPGEVFSRREGPGELLIQESYIEALGHPGLTQRITLYAAPAVRFLILVLGLFAAYGLTLRTVAGHRSRALELTLFGTGALFLLIQMIGPAMLSGDLFSYAMYGRIFGMYGGNPYAQPPDEYPGDPYLPLLVWRDIASYYGPLWTLVSAGLASLGGDQIGLTVLLFRGMAVACALIAAALLWVSLQRLAPDRAAQGLVFFLWNPLVVLETGLSGHNDAAMAVLLLLGIWLHVRGRQALAVAALTLSALVKYITFLVLPLYVLLLLRRLPSWRERCRCLAVSAAASLLVVGLVIGLVRAGPEMVAVGSLGSGVSRYSNSVHELLYLQLRLRLGEKPESVEAPLDPEKGVPLPAQQANTWLRLTAGIAFGAFWLLAARRANNLRSFLVWSTAIMLAACWLLAAWIWPWYVLWSIALAALVPTSRAAGLAVVLSATVLSLYAWFDYESSARVWIYTYRSIPAFVLPLIIFGLAITWRSLIKTRIHHHCQK